MNTTSLALANGHFRKGHYRKALELYRQLKSNNPRTKLYEYNIQQCILKLKQERGVTRVCVVSSVILGINPEGGGIATAMSNLAISLAKNPSYAVDLLYTQASYNIGNHAIWAKKYQNLYHVKLLNLAQDSKKHFGTHEMKRSYFVAEHMKKMDYDIAIFPDYLGLAYFSCQARVNGLLTKTLLAINCHGNHRLSTLKGNRPIKGMQEIITYEMEEESIKLADYILSPSLDYLEYWDSKVPSVNNKARLVIPNINDIEVNNHLSDLDSIADAPPPPDRSPSQLDDHSSIRESPCPGPPKTNVFFFSRLERRKGLDLFLECVETISNEYNCCFHIYGPSTLIDGIASEDYIGKRLDHKNIRYQVYTKRSLKDFVNHIKSENGILLYTTLWENSPCTVVEIAKHGIMMLAPDIPGILEMLSDSSRESVIFETGSASSLLRMFREFMSGNIKPLPEMSYSDEDIELVWSEFICQAVSANETKSYSTIKETSVSVIIPTIGRINMLQETILSLMNQSSPPQEIIISHDALQKCQILEDICKKLNCTYMNSGRVFKGKASNVAAKKATSDTLLFFDDDDIASFDYISSLVSAINAKRYDVISSFQSVYSDHENFAEHTKLNPPEYISMCIGGRNLSINAIQNYLAKGCFAISKEKFLSIGGYDVDTDVLPCVDYRFFLKCITNSYSFGIIPFPIYSYRKCSSGSLFANSQDTSKLKRVKGLILKRLIEHGNTHQLQDYLELMLEHHSNPKFT